MEKMINGSIKPQALGQKLLLLSASHFLTVPEMEKKENLLATWRPTECSVSTTREELPFLDPSF